MLIPGGIVVRAQDEDRAYDERRQRMVDAECDLVDQAFRDILKADFDSPAVCAVMGRRAGTIDDYVRMKDQYAAAASAVQHARTG